MSDIQNIIADTVLPYVMHIISEIFETSPHDLYNDEIYDDNISNMFNNELNLQIIYDDDDNDYVLTTTFKLVDKDYKLEKLSEIESHLNDETCNNQCKERMFNDIFIGINMATDRSMENIKLDGISKNPLKYCNFTINYENNTLFPKYDNYKDVFKRIINLLKNELDKDELNLDEIKYLLNYGAYVRELIKISELDDYMDLDEIKARYNSSKHLSVRFKKETKQEFDNLDLIYHR